MDAQEQREAGLPGEMRCTDTPWEEYTAHLTLLGWRPVRYAGGDGIYNDALSVGFVQQLRASHSDPLGQRIGEVCHTYGGNKSVEWADIGRDVMLAIEERLDRV